MTTLSVHDLTKKYGGDTVLDAVSFTTTLEKPLALRGSNGTGKTTLLRCLEGSVRPDEGRLCVDGAEYDPGSIAVASTIYSMLDDFAWFPELTVEDHLMLLDPKADPEAALATFGAAHLTGRTAASLSSGQMRRAALATTVVRPWKVLLLDEPEQRLDDVGIEQLVGALRGFLAEGRCVVLSTHSDKLSAALGADEMRLA